MAGNYNQYIFNSQSRETQKAKSILFLHNEPVGISAIQQSAYSKSNYAGKRNAGIALTVVGASTFVAGVTLAALTTPTTYQNANGTGGGVAFNGIGAAGIIMAVLSPALFIPGAILWKKGTVSSKMQRKRPN